ncbi:uncharacterized protein METZ01_LOCUS195112, partial [marine metagenome]
VQHNVLAVKLLDTSTLRGGTLYCTIERLKHRLNNSVDNLIILEPNPPAWFRAISAIPTAPSKPVRTGLNQTRDSIF